MLTQGDLQEAKIKDKIKGEKFEQKHQKLHQSARKIDFTELVKSLNK